MIQTAGVELEEISLVHRRKPIFGPVSVSVGAGDVLVVDGPIGSGRTCLLLTIGGRMNATGQGHVAGYELPRDMKQIRRHVALGPFPHLNDPDDALSVAQHVAEALLLHRFSPTLSVGRSAVHAAVNQMNARVEAIEPVARAVHEVITGSPSDPSLPVVAPLSPGTLVADMSPLERFTLSVGLALVDDPAVLLVDDVDELRSVDERSRAWALLLGLRVTRPDRPLTIVASCEHDGLDPAVLGDLATVARRPLHILDLPGCRVAASATASAGLLPC